MIISKAYSQELHNLHRWMDQELCKDNPEFMEDFMLGGIKGVSAQKSWSEFRRKSQDGRPYEEEEEEVENPTSGRTSWNKKRRRS